MSEQKKALEKYYADIHSGAKNPTLNLELPEQEIMFSGLKSVTDFESDEEVIKDYGVVMDALARNKTYTSGILDTAAYSDDGPSEFLRDLTFRIGTKVNVASEVKNWTEEEKQAFARMKNKWDNVSVSGMKEYMGAIKDYGIDAVANLETIPALASLIFQGGTGAAAAQGASRAALSKTLSKVVAASQPTTTKGFATYGAAFGGADDVALQNLEIETGAREDFNLGETASTAAVGAIAGAGLKKGIDLFKGRNTSKLANKQAETDLENKLLTEIPEEEGLKVFEAGVAKGDIPVSANSVIVDLGKLIENNPDIDSKTIADILEDSESAISVNINKFAKDSGGGKQTVEELKNIVLQAVETGATGKQIRNKVSHSFYKNATSLLGHTYGSAAGVLTPYKNFSKSAETLQKLLNYRYNIKFFTRTEQDVEMDFNEVATRLTGDLNNEFLTTLEPVAMNQLTGEMEDKVNIALNLAVRGRKTGDKQIDEAGEKIANSFKRIGNILYKEGIIQHKIENYFPRMWDRKTIELDASPNGKNELAEIFVKQGEAKDIAEGKEIVKEMLNKENQLSSGTSGHFFSATRVFKNIKDDAEIAKFLNNDLRATVQNYNFQAGKSLAKKKVLGVTNEKRFIEVWVNRIDAEMTAAGKPLSVGEKETIVDLYRTTTGENLDRYGSSTQNLVDGYTLATRAALLGLATPSSLTEIMINFSKAGLVNTIKGFKDAREQSFKLVTSDINTMLKNKHGLTAKEAYREQAKVGIGHEQAMSQIGNRIAGDDLVNEKMQKLNNKFFRITLLDQWTKFVQRSSFFTARHFIQENLETIAKHGNAPMTNKVRSAMQELNELNINPTEGVKWLNKGANKKDDFYQLILNGAGRYTNNVILNPTGMAGTKPILHSKPTTSIYFQLMGYPAAFSNVVLKEAGKKIIQDPVKNVPKTLITAMLMTETARQVNWLRSRGESEKNKSKEQIYLAALSRTGGLGLFADTLVKTEKASGFNRSPSGAVLTSFLGPVAGDASGLFLKGPAQVAGGKVPFYSVGTAVFGRDAMKKYRKTLREVDSKLLEGMQIEEEYRAPDRFNKGGEVNVPNAPIEPDERINKLTGLPYNYEAGSAYMDEDDPLKTQRGGFVIGGIVKGATKLASKAFSPKGDSGFFSMAEKKAMDLNQNKGSGDQFISMLKKNGVTEDELEFTGFNNEFAGKPKVTKEEIVGYLNVNRLDVESRTGRPSKFDEEKTFNRSDFFEDVADDPYAYLDDDVPVDDFFEDVSDDIDLDSEFTPVSEHKEYSWEGPDTQDYREITLSLPKNKQQGERAYTTDHFPDQENVVAHVRLADIVTADGKEVLLLDELQSDVHKAGSKFGYMSKKQQNLKAQLEQRRIAIVEKLKETEGKLVRADLNIFKTEKDNQEIAQLKAEMSRLTEKRSELLDEAFAQLTLNENKVPEMPFKQRKGSGWAQLGIKRALIEAAEKDYDTLAMTTGQQQVDRYAEAIEDSSGFYKRYDRDYIKILNKFGAKYGQKVEMIEVLQGDDIVEVPSINLTEEWKNDIQRGLPQFNKGGKVLKKLKRNCA